LQRIRLGRERLRTEHGDRWIRACEACAPTVEVLSKARRDVERDPDIGSTISAFQEIEPPLALLVAIQRLGDGPATLHLCAGTSDRVHEARGKGDSYLALYSAAASPCYDGLGRETQREAPQRRLPPRSLEWSAIMVPLSVLDLPPITAGSDAAQSFRNTFDLARHAERLGYRRFWLAEHHGMPGIA